MSALPLRRALLVIVPLALMLAGCDGGEGKPGVPSGLGDTNPEAGQQPAPAQESSFRCTEERLAAVAPCQGEDVGSECTVVGGRFVPWIDGGPMAPEISWTYPCTPDTFEVFLAHSSAGAEPLASRRLSGDAAAGLTYTWSPNARLLLRGIYEYEIVAHVGGEHSGSGDLSINTDFLCEDLWSSPPYPFSPAGGIVLTTPQEFTEGFYPPAPEGAFLAIPGFDWNYSGSRDCVSFHEGQISSDSTFATGVMPIEGLAVGGVVEWCHTYYWRVREYLPDKVGPWSEVASFRIAPPEGWDTCFGGLAQSMAVATMDSRCRIGPSTAYRIAAYVAAGESHPIDGRNAAGTWYRLQDLHCYIFREQLAVQVGGTPFPGGADVGSLMSLIPEVPDPPLPTATTVNEAGGPSGPACSASLSPAECSAGGWPYNYDLNSCMCP